MDKWEPITKEELEAIISEQLADCSLEKLGQRAVLSTVLNKLLVGLIGS